MALSEIEKLERRYAENPQGLTFAPLAEVHRKNGEIQRALDLLKSGLAIHPDYIPASIVLGRCHLDIGDVQAAETAFLHVLALDGENVIALKALADISERLLRFDDAERWLQTLLSVDRSNDDAREQLQRVETSRRQAGVASAADSAGALEPEAAPAMAQAAQSATASAAAESPSGAELSSAADASTAVEPSPLAEATEATSASPFEAPVAEPAMGWVSQSSEVSGAARASVEDLEPSTNEDRAGEIAELELEKPAGIEIEEPIHYDEPVEPLDGLVGRDVDTPNERADEFRVETSEDIVLRSSGGNEFQVPDASQELFAGGAFGERARSEPPLEAAQEPLPETAGAMERERDESEMELTILDSAAASDMAAVPAPTGASERATVFEPAAVSDLGARSGSVTRHESAAPSESAAASEPMEVSEPAAEYEPMMVSEAGTGSERRSDRATAEAAPTADRVAPEAVAATPVSAEPMAAGLGAPEVPLKRAYAAGETGGRPVAQLLKNILSARPPAHSAPAPVRQAPGTSGSGAPTRPAADALSLSSVFGEEAPAAPPAMPTAGQGSGVSFDDFFGSPGTSPASRSPRNPDPKNDDLDQFHAWLQNLKR